MYWLLLLSLSKRFCRLFVCGRQGEGRNWYFPILAVADPRLPTKRKFCLKHFRGRKCLSGNLDFPLIAGSSIRGLMKRHTASSFLCVITLSNILYIRHTVYFLQTEWLSFGILPCGSATNITFLVHRHLVVSAGRWNSTANFIRNSRIFDWT